MPPHRIPLSTPVPLYTPLPPSTSISSTLLLKLLGEFGESWPPSDPLTSPPCLLPPPWPRPRPYPLLMGEWEEEEVRVATLYARWEAWDRERERAELAMDNMSQALALLSSSPPSSATKDTIEDRWRELRFQRLVLEEVHSNLDKELHLFDPKEMLGHQVLEREHLAMVGRVQSL